MKAKRILASVLSVALLLQLSPLGVLALDEGLPQTPQVSTVQENLDPTPTEEPAPTADPSPEETAAPTAAPTPAPTEEPTAEPTATPAAEEAAPDAAETPAPEPSAEPTAAPDPAAEVQAMINALPGEVTEDNAAAVEQALTDIDDAKESLTDDELAGLDFARYDAAANALLALWGEAATDAVELLDNAAAPTQDGEGYYLIDTPEKLRWFATKVNNGQTKISARLTANITMDGTEWTPIGTSQAHPFEGIFDGNGKTITGLTYTDTSKNYVGLVGFADGATIQNVTVQDSSLNGKEYIGAVCGFIVRGNITGCTNNGSTVNGWANSGSSGQPGWNIGGIVGQAQDSTTTIQRCINTGKVTGINDIGGIVGSTANATVRDCGNTGEVRTTGIGIYYGGIAGSVYESSYIHNCYNTDSSTADKFYDGSCYHSNCYYLANGSDSTDKEITAKTQAQFASGEVAYLLQGNRAEPVWGQTIHTDTYPKLGGDKVYQSAPCPSEYSNTEPKTTPHNYVDRKCIYCGESEPPKEVNGYYEIYDQGQLYWFAKLVNGTLQGMPANPAANAVLMNTIDITVDTVDTVGNRWPGIGTNGVSYSGSFNGNGYTVTLTGADTANKMLFGTTSTDARLDTICVTGGYLTQTDSAVVTNCYRPESDPLFQNKTAGSAVNCYTLGMLVEQESDGATFTSCYAGAGSGNGINIMNADAFTNGEVAYLLAQGDSQWGQTLTGANNQAYPVLGGEKVYRSTPCPTDYSNVESKNKDHNIGNDGKCTDCGELCIAYTVTIPATVELGNAASTKADITAKDVTLPANQTLKVTINGINGTNGINGIDSTNDINGTNGINGSNGVFTATLDDTSETVSYKIKNGNTELTPGDTVLTAASGEAKTTALTFVKPDNVPYAGSYTGTVTFTVSVVETTH